MALTTRARIAANDLLKPLGLRLETLTRENAETGRLKRLRTQNQFSEPKLPLLPGMTGFTAHHLIEAFSRFGPDVEKLIRGGATPGFYNPSNNFYKSPDAEVLYLMVRSLRPRTIVEVGSGNSTRIIRQAISDGALNVDHIAIDPDPRDDIKSLVSRMYLDRFEEIDTTEIMAKLGPGDLLFIDSSHEVRVANEVAKLFCVVLPALPSGVTVHVHDIYLPFDYPEPIATRFSDWGEQYLLQAILSARPHVLLWPGYYVHKFLPGLKAQLPFLDSGVPQSLWYRVS